MGRSYIPIDLFRPTSRGPHSRLSFCTFSHLSIWKLLRLSHRLLMALTRLLKLAPLIWHVAVWLSGCRLCIRLPMRTSWRDRLLLALTCKPENHPQQWIFWQRELCSRCYGVFFICALATIRFSCVWLIFVIVLLVWPTPDLGQFMGNFHAMLIISSQFIS